VEKADRSCKRCLWQGVARGRRDRAENWEKREASDAREAGNGVAIATDASEWMADQARKEREKDG
jgi:hypothetical protein